ncbi:uncharacterized protein VDAG_07275 [Verticillium dahliae VdLs.17]|uniref:Uncharacterized protein n=1 Tax=Verticillium dahliae (strain VdLs.17 / ATCC MYA-4575 / FGSC 10137) TaxID=498257 RepID=G2XBD7_VERDV|nr:uncharacterized protein VDAG_07275 [Verticillium dahliae VdLs.17]EGY16111.1 hypothetical protein VDAG_07275 [Verticillium dahliae VdLs.17]KAH6687071.1 hypothetical protein EV126DRAFT_349697 [Verticillium dahliae]
MPGFKQDHHSLHLTILGISVIVMTWQTWPTERDRCDDMMERGTGDDAEQLAPQGVQAQDARAGRGAQAQGAQLVRGLDSDVCESSCELAAGRSTLPFRTEYFVVWAQ